jgi:hypothetical protein
MAKAMYGRLLMSESANPMWIWQHKRLTIISECVIIMTVLMAAQFL